MDLITQAKMFATQKHVLDNRQLYGVVPYTHHLADVEQVLLRFDAVFQDDALRAAAWLHDVVEDTRGKQNEVRVRDIEEIFGEDIGMLVSAVTSEDGPNRKTRNALTYPKIRTTGDRAIALKLADRIANIEFGGRALEMYKKEYAEFRFNLRSDKPAALYAVNQMWHHLDLCLGWDPHA
jgi:(p)ppGpp synthase/HD superfamily hydrolase